MAKQCDFSEFKVFDFSNLTIPTSSDNCFGCDCNCDGGYCDCNCDCNNCDCDCNNFCDYCDTVPDYTPKPEPAVGLKKFVVANEHKNNLLRQVSTVHTL